MTTDAKASFEPFITVSIVNVTEKWGGTASKIAVASHCPGVTSIHVHDGAAARKLAAELNRLADQIDPPPTGPAECTSTPVKRKRRIGKAKRAKRK